MNQEKDNLQKGIQSLPKKLNGNPLLKVSHQMIWDQIMCQMYSCWKHSAILQDEMDLVIVATKSACDILTQLDKNIDTAKTVIDNLNEKLYQDIHDLAIRYRTNLVIESNKVITKKYLAQNVLDLASQLYHDVGSFKSLFDHILHLGLPGQCKKMRDL